MSTATRQHKPESLAEWTHILCEQDMPIFSSTATDIYQSLDHSTKGAMELASVILKDPNLTAKLLKISNSSYYNPSRQKISTVSRATVILGANTIRELTLACAFFESVLPAANQIKAHQEIAQAIHAAVQAREIAIMLEDPSPEEVFIAALLHTIGQISFWCFAEEEGKLIQRLQSTSELDQEQAEIKVLGFSLARLSKSLTRAWHLNGLIEEAISSPQSDNPRIRSIHISHAISQASQLGENSPELKECLSQLAHLTGKNVPAAKTYFDKCKAKAADIAAKFGAYQASELINPVTTEQKKTKDPVDETSNCKQIQFQLLQDITDHISGAINLNVLLELVLEGIHRGLNMDRTVFLLLSSDKKRLKEKFFLGKHSSTNHKLEIPLVGPANIFSECLSIQDSIWAKSATHHHLFSPDIQATLGRMECFIMPVTTENKVIGLIYCDRYQQQCEFTDEDFKTSKHFARQADIGLTLYRMRNN